MAWAAADGEVDVTSAEAGLSVLLEACERSLEELGAAVPPAQMRALLIIGGAGSLNLSRLALALGASASAASRLVDRMQAAGLLTRDRAAASRREIVLVPTESGAAAGGVGAGAAPRGAGRVAAGHDPRRPGGAGPGAARAGRRRGELAAAGGPEPAGVVGGAGP